MPLLPEVDNAVIRVDSLPDTRVHDFIFSADKTKIYAIVLTASTGVFADHTLVEYDQLGHRLRQLPLGEMAIQTTELALFQRNTLVWQFSNIFYVVDLQSLTVVDKVHTYWTGNYPDVQQHNDQKAVAEESRTWFRQKQQKIGRQFDIQKVDSVTLAVLEGNKTNADDYQAAIREARSQQTDFESDQRKAYYEAYALARIRSAKSTVGYRSPGGKAAYVFTKFTDGSTAAFQLDDAPIQKAGVKFLTCDVNPRITSDWNNDRSSLTEGRFILAEGQSLTDKTGVLQLTEGIVTKRNNFLLGGSSPDEFLFYYELKLGRETAHFKWLYPLGLSNDFYLQSANGSAYVLKAGVLYWFHA